MENGVQMTLEQWMPQIFQKQTVGASERLVRTSQWPESGEDLKETDPHSLEKYLESLEKQGKRINLNGSSMKMLKECLAATEDLTSCPYSLNWMWGGYDIEWQLLNSKLHGVPQNRERVYTIGHLRSRGSRKVFPLKAADGKDCVQHQQNGLQGGKLFKQFPGEKFLSMNDAFITDVGTDTASTVTARYYKGLGNHKDNLVVKQIGKDGSSKRDNPNQYRVYETEALGPCLNSCGGGREPHIPVIVEDIENELD